MALPAQAKLRRIVVGAAPAAAVAAAVGLALVIGGPAAIAFTVGRGQVVQGAYAVTRPSSAVETVTIG
jgi:hypothetical protein